MKRIKSLIVLVLLVAVAFVLVGCGEKESKVVEIVFNNGTEVSIDTFDFDTADFTLIKEDGTKETVKGTALTIADEELVKLVDAGIYDITLGYGKDTFTTKMAIRASEDEIIKPTKENTACFVVSDSHYENGVQYTAVYVGGKDESAFLAFEFKLTYDNTKVSNIKITPTRDYADKIKINDNGSRISVNFVDSNPGPLNSEIFRIEYTSTELYKNFALDTQSDYGFYRYANKEIRTLNCTFNFNW